MIPATGGLCNLGGPPKTPPPAVSPTSMSLADGNPVPAVFFRWIHGLVRPHQDLLERPPPSASPVNPKLTVTLNPGAPCWISWQRNLSHKHSAVIAARRLPSATMVRFGQIQANRC